MTRVRTHHELGVDVGERGVHGGTDDLENLQTLCRRCNCRKGVRVDA